MENEGSLGRTSAEETLRSIARSVDLLAKLAVRQSQGDLNLNEMIMVLHSLGCRPVEIAGLLGRKAKDVRTVISHARKGTKKGKGRRVK
jgi:hypothetical protein